MMEVVVTTGAIRRAFVQSSSLIVTTNKPTPNFLQAGCPSCHATNIVKALEYFILISINVIDVMFTNVNCVLCVTKFGTWRSSQQVGKTA